MRTPKLVPTFAAMAALLAVIPAGASAVRGAHRHVGAGSGKRHSKRAAGSGNCRLSINVEPRQITTGDPVAVFGRLTCKGTTSAASQTVTLYQSSAGTPGTSSVGTATTDANGFYDLAPASPQTNSTYYTTAEGAQSPSRALKVKARVSLSGPPDGSQLFTGRRRRNLLSSRITFTGTVSPTDGGARVVLQRESALSGEEWHRIGIGVVASDGTYSIPHTFSIPGDANIRVVVRPGGVNAPSPSEPLSYEISQAQNPSLTLFGAPDPILFGGSLAITGTVASGAGQPVTLMARTRTSAFAAVAKGMADGSGDYTFSQQPQQSTFYKVTAGNGTSSAVQFEGVKYALTPPTVSPGSTVLAGQTFTVSGAVSPAHTGHVIYLQRRNPGGVGFHTVNTGLVSAAGTYATTDAVFGGATKKEYRIRIPGDPENQGAASPPFTIEITPSAAATLTPQLPGNLPGPGQV